MKNNFIYSVAPPEELPPEEEPPLPEPPPEELEEPSL